MELQFYTWAEFPQTPHFLGLDVVVRTGEGLVANTPRLTYNADSRQAHGEEGVTMKGPDYQMRADRFTLSAADQTFTFEGTVQAVLGGATE